MTIKENVQVPKEIAICDLSQGHFFRFVNEITGYQYGLGLRLNYSKNDSDMVDVYDFEQEEIIQLPEIYQIIPIETDKIHITIDRLNEEK